VSKGRPRIDRELEAWHARLAVIDAGLLACYETIEEANRQKAVIKAKIAAQTNGLKPALASGETAEQISKGE
jgi:hypothetical protein